MSDKRNRVCPVERSGSLDSWYRRIVQNPEKILRGHVREGMTVLDVGCGPGYFTIPIAKMVGKKGHVIAADLQQGMLDRLGRKIENTELKKRILLHKSGANAIGVSGKADFILVFYMMHEVPDHGPFLRELRSILKEDGEIFIVEPRFFHVSRKAFNRTVHLAEETGLQLKGNPGLLFSRTALFRKKK